MTIFEAFVLSLSANADDANRLMAVFVFAFPVVPVDSVHVTALSISDRLLVVLARISSEAYIRVSLLTAYDVPILASVMELV